MKWIARLAAVLLLLPLGTPARAQTLLGTIEGTVTDQQGGALPGVSATLTGPRGTQTAVTDAEGRYRFVGVQPGTYTVRVELSSFAPEEQEATLGIGKTVTVDFSLQLAGVTEAVQVVGAASTVDVKSAATDTTVSNNMLQATPLYDSTASDLLTPPRASTALPRLAHRAAMATPCCSTASTHATPREDPPGRSSTRT